jgi:hypothetical protein
MNGYHHILVHFPVALWTLAFLLIVLRTVSRSDLARAGEKLLLPILGLGAVTGLAALVSGMLIWPLETATATPLGRNKIALAIWSVAFWSVLSLVYWRARERVWGFCRGCLMLVLGAMGTVMAAITGTLGGHLAGNPTALSQFLRALDWEIYTTVYVPSSTAAVLAAVGVILFLIGLVGRRA